jgi:hypothetical protein
LCKIVLVCFLDILYNSSTMTEDDYKKALDTARAEMGELVVKKDAIEKRIAQLRQLIVSLSAVSAEDNDEDIKLYIPGALDKAARTAALGVAQAMMGSVIGLSDAIRDVLKAAKGWQYPTEVRDGLERLGIDVQSYSNILASIHTILKRLVESGEAEEYKSKEGKTAYRWKHASINTNYVVDGKSALEKAVERHLSAEKVKNETQKAIDEATRPPRRSNSIQQAIEDTAKGKK